MEFYSHEQAIQTNGETTRRREKWKSVKISSWLYVKGGIFR